MEQWLLDMCMEFVKHTDGVILGKRHRQPGQMIFSLLCVFSLSHPYFFRYQWLDLPEMRVYTVYYKPLWSSCQNSLMTHLPHQFVIGNMSLRDETLNWTNNAGDAGRPSPFFPPSTWKGPWLNTMLLVGNRHPSAHIVLDLTYCSNRSFQAPLQIIL